MYYMEKPDWELIISGLAKSRDNTFNALRASNGDGKDLSLIYSFRVFEARCRALQIYMDIGTPIPYTDRLVIVIYMGVMSDIMEVCKLKPAVDLDTTFLIEYLYHPKSDSYIHPNLYIADTVFEGIGKRYLPQDVIAKASDAELKTIVECIRVFGKHGLADDNHRKIVTMIDSAHPRLYERGLQN